MGDGLRANRKREEFELKWSGTDGVTATYWEGVPSCSEEQLAGLNPLPTAI